jgi:hypothetical protein
VDGIAGDFGERPITETGVDQLFLITCVVVVTMLGGVLFAARRLRKMRKPSVLSDLRPLSGADRRVMVTPVRAAHLGWMGEQWLPELRVTLDASPSCAYRLYPGDGRSRCAAKNHEETEARNCDRR